MSLGCLIRALLAMGMMMRISDCGLAGQVTKLFVTLAQKSGIGRLVALAGIHSKKSIWNREMP